MAAFDTTNQKISSIYLAVGLMNDVRGLYTQAKSVQSKLALYTANTDATFKAATDAIFTSAERAELAAMLGQINTLVTDWEVNHKGPLGLP